MAEQEHRVIFLEPRCSSEAGEDRHWCHDDPWGTCDECGTPSVKYIIASEHEAMAKDLAEAVRLLDALLGLEKGSGQAALEFVERHGGRVGGSSK